MRLQRGLKSGDIAEIYNERGRLHIRVKVTDRVLPGVITVPQGAWRSLDTTGVDTGGCINTLTNWHHRRLLKIHNILTLLK